MALQTRSTEPDGGVDVYWPDGHAPLCVLHARSLLVVAAVVWYSPEPHTVAPVHAAPSTAALYVLPRMHSAHARFAVAVPPVAMPWPRAQSDQAMQLSTAAVAVNWPLGQVVHTRSLEVVAAV